MSVKDKTRKESEKTEEKKIEEWINKGGGVQLEAPKDSQFKVITLRMPKEILDQIDAIIKENPWLARNTWIVSALKKQLNSREIL